MRKARSLALASLWLAGLGAAQAESIVERAATVVDEVCLRATSSAALMAAGDGAARRYGWSLNPKQSGTQRGLIPLSKDKAVAVSWRKKVWDFVGHDGKNGLLSVQVLASGKGGQRLDSCQVAVPGDVAADVEAEIGRKVALNTRATLPSSASGWVLSGSPERPDQGYRLLGISTQGVAAPATACTNDPCPPSGKRPITAVGVLDFKTTGVPTLKPGVP